MFRSAALAAALALAFGVPDQNRPIQLEAADCSQVNMMFGDYEVGRAVQHARVPVTAGPLELRPDTNGGVRIERGSGGEYAITACVGAGARTRAEAQAAADSVRLEVTGNRVRVRGAEGRNVQSWSVQLIVLAPDVLRVVSIQPKYPDFQFPYLYLAGSFGLFVLGGYLTLSGHRRHLYESGDRLTAYLADVTPVLEQNGLTLTTDDLPWDRWDQLQRRLT